MRNSINRVHVSAEHYLPKRKTGNEKLAKAPRRVLIVRALKRLLVIVKATLWSSNGAMKLRHISFQTNIN